MLRTISTCERNVFVEPPRVVTLAAATSTEIFPDESTNPLEIVTRYVQNLTGGDLFLTFHADVANNTNQIHVVITNYQLFECFPDRGKVTGYSVAGGNVSTVKIIRNDREL